MADEPSVPESKPLTDEEDERVFRLLLSRADTVLKCEVRHPLVPEPIVVYYRQLASGEAPAMDLPEDFATLKREEKIRLIFRHNSDSVWAMIDKAQKTDPSIPKKYRLTKEEWFGMRERLPQVHDLIVMEVTGLASRVDEVFFGRSPPTSNGGPKAPASE